MPKRTEMALPVPTKSLLRTSPDAAMLFAPFGCTHPPPPVPPFLLTQNLSPKDIAGSDIMKLKISFLLQMATFGKVLISKAKKLVKIHAISLSKASLLRTSL